MLLAAGCRASNHVDPKSVVLVRQFCRRPICVIHGRPLLRGEVTWPRSRCPIFGGRISPIFVTTFSTRRASLDGLAVSLFDDGAFRFALRARLHGGRWCRQPVTLISSRISSSYCSRPTC